MTNINGMMLGESLAELVSNMTKPKNLPCNHGAEIAEEEPEVNSEVITIDMEGW